MSKLYTVRPESPGSYVVVDTKTGTYVNRFHVPGDLVNGPIVSGDSCTVVTRVNNTNTGYVIKIPTGYLVNRFSG